MVPLLLGTKSALLDAKVDLPLVSGQQNYLIPQRAALSKVHLLTYVDAAGTESKPLKKVERADIHDYAATGVPTAFYFIQSEIALLPAPSESVGYLRIRYPRRPSDLVLATLVATVTAVTSNTRLTVDAVPAGIVTGKKVDVGQALSPFKPLADDLAVTATGATTIDIGAGGLNALGIVAGDFVTFSALRSCRRCRRNGTPSLLLRSVARLANDARDSKSPATTRCSSSMEGARAGRVQDERADGNPKRLNAWRGHRRRWGWR
jgi:hypothetical protein